MRIALVTTSWPRGPDDPAGHFVRAEVRELTRAGHEVRVVAPLSGGAFGWPGVGARLRERPERAFEAAMWVWRARRQLRRMPGMERIVCHWAVPCGWPIATGAGRPVELVSHGADIRLLAALPRGLRRHIVARLVAHASRWRFVSQSLLEQLLVAVDLDQRAAVVGLSAVEAAALEVPDVRDGVRRRRAGFGGARVAVSVGRLVASKRVDRAIEHVARERDAELLVVVGDGPERASLEDLASALGVSVRFVGVRPRREALEWIGAADVLLMASEAEGLSTVVREAEALGTRVLWIGEGS